MSEARSPRAEQPNPEKKPDHKPAAHEDDVVGKAYDGRLMRRLLTYLRPYKWQAGISLVAIILKALADVLGPYLVKVAVDTYMTHDAAPASSTWLARHLSTSARRPASPSSPSSTSALSASPTCSSSSRPT